MAYGHITLGQLRAQLAERLSDSFNVFWSAPELNLYINEALQTFSAFSAFWRNRGSFNTQSGVTYYDLPAQMPSICGYNVQDITIIPEICYHILEPVPTGLGTSAAWVGTDMFSLDVVTQALQRRRDQFLSDTGMVVTQLTMPMPSAPIGRVTFPDTTIDIRRLQSIQSGGTPYNSLPYGIGPYGGFVNSFSNLWRLTEWQLTTQSQLWSVNPSQPYGYSIISTPPLSVQIGPLPSNVSSLDAIVVNTGLPLNPSTGVLLGIPDDFCWIPKWGAVADLLGMDGQARDVQRAQFCEQRYQIGVELAKQSVLALQGQINGVPQIIGSIQGADSLNPNWQGAPGTPTAILTGGRNLVATNPPPDNIYSLTFDVVANATLPVSDGSFIQIGREQLDGIIDYAEHLACFKMGGAEFQMTMRQADNFIKTAAGYNSRISASSLFSVPTGNQSRQQEFRQPREMAGKAING